LLTVCEVIQTVITWSQTTNKWRDLW